MDIYFPRNLNSDRKGIEFISYLWGQCKKINNSTIIWDLSSTKILQTNILSVIGLILNRVKLRNNKVILRIKKNNKDETIADNYIISRLFHLYSYNHGDGLKYVYFDFDKNNLDVFLKDKLKELRLKDYEKLKIILSEMCANIKMHASPCEGSLCSYINIKENKLYISICNFGFTIKQNVELKNKYSFEDDGSAILWALKKLNTTREDNVSGGLGLYLLRKYMFEMNGEAEIVSGKYFVSLKENFYNNINVNHFFVDKEKMRSFFPGVMITIKIDFILLDNIDIKENNIINEINLCDI